MATPEEDHFQAGYVQGTYDAKKDLVRPWYQQPVFYAGMIFGFVAGAVFMVLG